MAAISSLALVPITRLRDVYLAVATLGFTVIVFLIFLNTEWLTGGSFGMMGIPRPSIGSISLSERGIYFLCFAVMVVIYFTFNRLVDSRFGRGLQAIMLDEDAAWSSGINVTLYKSKCFIIAAMVTGFAGSLFSAHSRYLNPDDFSFWKSIEILLMVAVGGIGSMTGAIVGAFVVVLLPEYLRAVDQWRLVIFGALLVLFMGLGKGGIAGFVSLTLGRVRTIFDRKNRRLPGRKGVSQ
jgi:branched-chain amino acid transport system permease protein